MQNPKQIADRWRYLRDLLQAQLARVEDGSLQIHASGVNVSQGAAARLKKEIEDFNGMIRMSDRRCLQSKPMQTPVAPAFR